MMNKDIEYRDGDKGYIDDVPVESEYDKLTLEEIEELIKQQKQIEGIE